MLTKISNVINVAFRYSLAFVFGFIVSTSISKHVFIEQYKVYESSMMKLYGNLKAEERYSNNGGLKDL